ncbi:MAG: PhzF family phenazine biosynthesis protein [Solirubrobacterales bacterium]
MAAPPEIEVRVPRVFCGPGGTHGNPLGVVLDGPSVPADDRQALARHLAYSETVFVDDARRGRIEIYTPEVQLPFAGHPSVGTAWMLRGEGHEVDVLRPPAGEVPVRFEGETTWVAARPEWCPEWDIIEYPSPDEVNALAVESDGFRYCWAWIDEEAGIVRARSFVAEVGIGEDEATGSAALPLSARLGRAIEVRQGRGSVIHARPMADGFVEIGGSVVED